MNHTVNLYCCMHRQHYY